MEYRYMILEINSLKSLHLILFLKYHDWYSRLLELKEISRAFILNKSSGEF